MKYVDQLSCCNIQLLLRLSTVFTDTGRQGFLRDSAQVDRYRLATLFTIYLLPSCFIFCIGKAEGVMMLQKLLYGERYLCWAELPVYTQQHALVEMIEV